LLFAEGAPLAAHPAAGEIEDQSAGQGAVEQEGDDPGNEVGLAGGDQDGDIEPPDNDDHG
jgi:hypothetical protein